MISRHVYPSNRKSESRGDKNDFISTRIESYPLGSVYLAESGCSLRFPLDNGVGLLGWTAHQIAFKTVARASLGLEQRDNVGRREEFVWVGHR